MKLDLEVVTRTQGSNHNSISLDRVGGPVQFHERQIATIPVDRDEIAEVTLGQRFVLIDAAEFANDYVLKGPIWNIEPELKKINGKLFLLKNRGDGSMTFRAYDSASGLPKTQEYAYIVHRGEGKCQALDGGVLPGTGIHDWGNGWGAAVLSINPLEDADVLLYIAQVRAGELVKRFSQVLA